MKKIVFLTFLITLMASAPAQAWQGFFTPRLYAGEEFNDNVYLTNDNEENDFITSGGIGFEAGIQTKNSVFKANYDPRYNYFAKNTDLSFWEHKAGLDWQINFTRQTTFKLRDQYGYTEDPFFVTDVTVTEFKGLKKVDYTVRKDRRPYTTNTAEAVYTHETRNRNIFELSYLYSILKNDDEEIEDNERHNPAMELTYRLSPQSDLKLIANFTQGYFEKTEDLQRWEGELQLKRSYSANLDLRFTYNHALASFSGNKTGYQIYDPTVGFDYKLGKETSVSLDGGYFYQDGGAAGDESGFSGKLELKTKFELGTFSLSGSTGSGESYFGTENLGLGIYYEAGMKFSYQLSQSVSINLSATYRRDEYNNETLDEPRTDDIIRTGVGLAYNPGWFKWLFLNLNYIFAVVDSTDDKNDYGNNRVTLQFTFTPERPYFW
jgi:hypothetical protein